MEANFHPLRVAILAALLGAFALAGGFDAGAFFESRMSRAWFYCMALYVCGAVSTTVIDHYVGTMEPTNLRFVYVVVGILAMAGGGIWLFSIRQAIAG